MPEGWSRRHKCDILDRVVLDEVEKEPSPLGGCRRLPVMVKFVRLVALRLATVYKHYGLDTDAEERASTLEAAWPGLCQTLAPTAGRGAARPWS